MGCAQVLPTNSEVDDASVNEQWETLADEYGRVRPLSIKSVQADEANKSAQSRETAREALPRVVGQVSTPPLADPKKTIIIFDWDDTLCPTSWAKQQAMLAASQLDQSASRGLKKFACKVANLLVKAQALGKVFIVTNASRPRVDQSCSILMPQVAAMLKGIPIVYARELLSDIELASYPKSDLKSEAKLRAMQAVLRGFYSGGQRQCWDRVVSIGDSRHEHDAIRTASRSVPREPVPKACRTKTIKLLRCDSLKDLRCQLSIVTTWLYNIVQADLDMAIDFSDIEATINLLTRASSLRDMRFQMSEVSRWHSQLLKADHYSATDFGTTEDAARTAVDTAGADGRVSYNSPGPLLHQQVYQCT